MKQHIVFISIILFFTLMGIAGGATALEAYGRAQDRNQSLENAHIAAHFQCNRKRLWADLDTLRVVETESTQYTITGGRKRITDYITRVEFTCKAEYHRYPRRKNDQDIHS